MIKGSKIIAKVYKNADIQKAQILSENRGKVGIYRWVNKESGNSYIGSSLDLCRRIREYFSLAYLKRDQKSSAICNALLSKGYSNFMAPPLEILEYCSNKNILKREDHYFKLLKPEYKILSKADSTLGYKHKEETRLKISASRKGIGKGIPKSVLYMKLKRKCLLLRWEILIVKIILTL